jgi:hypothetical protein
MIGRRESTMMTLSISYKDGRHRDVPIRGDAQKPLRVPVDVALDWDERRIARIAIVSLAGPRAIHYRDVRIERLAGVPVTRDVDIGFSPLGEAP